jgi:hypothetical protein
MGDTRQNRSTSSLPADAIHRQSRFTSSNLTADKEPRSATAFACLLFDTTTLKCTSSTCVVIRDIMPKKAAHDACSDPEFHSSTRAALCPGKR